MIRQLIGERAFLLLVAQRYKHIFCAVFAVSAMLLISNQPAMAQFSIINVKNAPYNAQGDGVTDDSAAIQAAVNAASATPGSTVYFPIGTYFHSSAISVNGNRTTLRGQNRAVTLTGATVSYTGTGINISQLRTSITNPSFFITASKVGISNCEFNAPVIMNTTDDCQISNSAFIEGSNSTCLSFSGCNRVDTTQCNFTGLAVGSVLLTYANVNDITLRRCKFALTSGAYSLGFSFCNRGLVETCDFQIQNNFYTVVAGNFNGLTFRNNTMNSATRASTYGFYADVCNDLLFSGNKMRFYSQPLLVTRTTNLQAVSNNMSDCDLGANLQGNIGVFVATNGIYRSQSYGIYCDNYPGLQTIQQNTMRDCGLSTVTTVIYVSASNGANQALIQNNLYTGNQNNLQYYIRCELPAPPAVVRGNITTTMLPTLVGP